QGDRLRHPAAYWVADFFMAGVVRRVSVQTAAHCGGAIAHLHGAAVYRPGDRLLEAANDRERGRVVRRATAADRSQYADNICDRGRGAADPAKSGAEYHQPDHVARHWRARTGPGGAGDLVQFF